MSFFLLSSKGKESTYYVFLICFVCTLMVTSFFKYVVSVTECVWLMYIWIKLRWTEWYRVWSNIGNVKLHSNCQMASHHAPRFHLQHCKHNFASTDDSSGGRNGLRKVQVVLSSPTQRSPRSVHRWTKGDKTSQGSWISLAYANERWSLQA